MPLGSLGILPWTLATILHSAHALPGLILRKLAVMRAAFILQAELQSLQCLLTGSMDRPCVNGRVTEYVEFGGDNEDLWLQWAHIGDVYAAQRLFHEIARKRRDDDGKLVAVLKATQHIVVLW